MEHVRPHWSWLSPVSLSGLGILFLLNNLGFLNWNIWQMLFMLWPV
jgi:hypothetical protein